MSKHMISRHPLDGVDYITELFVEVGIDDNPDDARHVAECQAVSITSQSSVEQCAKVLANFLTANLAQLKAQREDRNKGHLYSNPIELIREESAKKKNKEIKHTGNIARAHERIKQLDSEIVSEETPKQMIKWIFWCTLIGIALLILAIFSVKTNGAVNLMTWIIDSKWFLLLFTAVTIGLSLYFRFVSAGVLMVGGFLALAWIVIKLPGLTSFILNGILFLASAILLFVSVFYIVSIVKYKPLPEDEHIANQERIAERDALKKELNEYSGLMIGKLDIMKQKFMDNEYPFRKELSKPFKFTDYSTGNVNPYGCFDAGDVYKFFSFLNKYYSKMKR